MGPILCARFKKSIKSRSSSPAAEADSSSSTQSLPSATAAPKRPYSDGRLSDRLRRRFSRERKSRTIHFPPRKSDRKDRVSVFSLSSRFSRTAALQDPVGSLTSERGYDSDAQCISSPRKASLSPSSPQAGRNLSPLAKGYARADLSDLSERSHERLVDDASDPMVDRHGADRSQEVADVVDQQVRRSEVGGPTAPIEQQADCQILRAGAQEACVANGSGDTRTTDTMSSDSVTRHGSIMVAKKRQQHVLLSRSLSDSRSVHLGDMDISQALASPSMSPLLLSQNQLVDEARREDVPGEPRISEDSGAAKLQSNQNEGTPFQRPKSSDFSAHSLHHPQPKTWGFSPIEKCLTKLERRSTGSRSLGYDGLSDAYPARTRRSESNAAAAQALKSKFIERFEKDTSSAEQEIAHDESGNGQIAPRRVSGWMSGGRRVGYGYSMVDPDQENIGGQEDLGEGLQQRLEGLEERMEQSMEVCAGGSRSHSLTTDGSSACIPSMMNHLGERDLPTTGSVAASPAEPPATEPRDTDSCTRAHHIWARVADRMKARGRGASSTVLANKNDNPVRRIARMYSSNAHIKERVSAKASGIVRKKASGNFRIRSLARGYNATNSDKGARNDDDSPLERCCGWTREARSATWLQAPDFASTGRDAGQMKPLAQAGSDDTTTTEDLVYQDCLEAIPGPIQSAVENSEELGEANHHKLWKHGRPRNDINWEEKKTDSTEGLEIIRDTIAVFNYLRTSAVWDKFKAINQNIRAEMQRAQDASSKLDDDKESLLDLGFIHELQVG
ncbi:hypothetical protein PHISP_01317 [Aspergillus sp. HF37]|nr:hypothetical protein PHISP_01317 [Aspergillus sp. HF37]